MGLPEAAGTSTERVPTLQSLPGGFGMGGSAGVRLSHTAAEAQVAVTTGARQVAGGLLAATPVRPARLM